MTKKLLLKSDRSFGLTMAIVTALFGFISFRNHSFLFYIFWPVAFLFLALGLAYPSKLHFAHVKWIHLGERLKLFTTPIFLSIFFYLFLTPVGLVLRIFGKDLLGLKKKAVGETYWLRAEEPSSFKDQF